MSMEIKSYLRKFLKVRMELKGDDFFYVFINLKNRASKELEFRKVIKAKVLAMSNEDKDLLGIPANEEGKVGSVYDFTFLTENHSRFYYFVHDLADFYATKMVVDWEGVTEDGEKLDYNASYMADLLSSNADLVTSLATAIYGGDSSAELVDFEALKKT